jgi:hypothetical protein
VDTTIPVRGTHARRHGSSRLLIQGIWADINTDTGRNGPARNNPVTYFTDRRMDT